MTDASTGLKTWVPKIIDSGTYGWIFYPSLACSGDVCIKTHRRVDYEHKVSKMLLQSDAEVEMKKYTLMHHIDPSNEFHVGYPYFGYLAPENRRYLAPFIYDNKMDDDFDDYRLIVMDHGGTNLHTFSKDAHEVWQAYYATLAPLAAFTVKSWTRGNDVPHFLSLNHAKIERITGEVMEFWKNVRHLIRGIRRMVQHRVIHHDIKVLNILYDLSNNRLNIIDFGMLETMQFVLDENIKNDYEYSVFYHNMPPELYFYHYKRYNHLVDIEGYPKRILYFNDLNRVNQSANDSSHQLFGNIVKYYQMEYNRFKQTDYSIIKMREKYETSRNGMKIPLNPLSADNATFSDVPPIHSKLQHNFQIFMMTVDSLYKDYHEFMEDAMAKLDIYGLGVTLYHVLLRTFVYLKKETVQDLYRILAKMAHGNVKMRIDAESLERTYGLFLDRHFPENNA